MTLIAVALAMVFPSGEPQATFHALPCDRRCRADRRRAIRQRRWVDKRLRAIAPYRGWLASTRACESHGDYSINTGNGYYGAYQFSLSTWYSVGGRGYPHVNPPLEQDYRAVILVRTGGTGHWPNCG